VQSFVCAAHGKCLLLDQKLFFSSHMRGEEKIVQNIKNIALEKNNIIPRDFSDEISMGGHSNGKV
jgi:hypothetical protein